MWNLNDLSVILDEGSIDAGRVNRLVEIGHGERLSESAVRVGNEVYYKVGTAYYSPIALPIVAEHGSPSDVREAERRLDEYRKGL